MSKTVNIELTYGDIMFQLYHTENGYDENLTNDVQRKIKISSTSASQTVKEKFTEGPAHAIAITGVGAVGAKFTIVIKECGVNSTFKVDKKGKLNRLVMFNVYGSDSE